MAISLSSRVPGFVDRLERHLSGYVLPAVTVSPSSLLHVYKDSYFSYRT
jgi:hypothetical protein